MQQLRYKDRTLPGVRSEVQSISKSLLVVDFFQCLSVMNLSAERIPSFFNFAMATGLTNLVSRLDERRGHRPRLQSRDPVRGINISPALRLDHNELKLRTIDGLQL